MKFTIAAIFTLALLITSCSEENLEVPSNSGAVSLISPGSFVNPSFCSSSRCPLKFRSISSTPTTISISWNGSNTQSFGNYGIYVVETSSNEQFTNILYTSSLIQHASVLNYTLTDLDVDTGYYLRIVYRTLTPTGYPPVIEYSPVYLGTTEDGIPNILNESNVTTSGFTINWSAVDDAIGYEIEFIDNVLGTTYEYSTTSTYYSFGNKSGCREYEYKVRTVFVSAPLKSEYSSLQNVETLAGAIGIPPSPPVSYSSGYPFSSWGDERGGTWYTIGFNSIIYDRGVGNIGVRVYDVVEPNDYDQLFTINTSPSGNWFTHTITGLEHSAQYRVELIEACGELVTEDYSDSFWTDYHLALVENAWIQNGRLYVKLDWKRKDGVDIYPTITNYSVPRFNINGDLEGAEDSSDPNTIVSDVLPYSSGTILNCRFILFMDYGKTYHSEQVSVIMP